MKSVSFIAATPLNFFQHQLHTPCHALRFRRRRYASPRAALPAFAADVVDAATATGDEVVKAGVNNMDGFVPVDTLSRNLSLLTFGLGVYCTIGIIILSWDNWRNKRNGIREMELWEAEGGEKRKRGLKTVGASTKGAISKSDGLNRQTRRISAKQQAQEEKLLKSNKKSKKKRSK